MGRAEERIAGIHAGRTSFIGRRREIDALVREIGRGSRLVTIVASSGMGKTRLARKVLDEAKWSGEAARFVGLAGCRTAGDLHAAVAGALGIPVRDETALAEAFANRGPTLLVLDNLEDVAAAARPFVGTWLDGSMDLQILATSIVPLDLAGEVRFELGPLESDDAVALYLDRAHGAWASRPAAVDDRLVVEELVGRLDRSPLAIELAAARVRILPPKLLLSRIDERFRLLRSDRPDRHGSLYRALAMTWDLLSEREQAILAQCAVFVGGFTLEAAEAILTDDGCALLDVLDGLRAKVLLQLDDSDPPRFSLYESVNEFASMALDKAGCRAEVEARHAAHFAALASSWASRFDGPDVPAAIGWFSSERKNVLAAHDRSRSAAPEVAARIGLALARLLLLEGPQKSTGEIFAATCEAARATGNPRLVAEALQNKAMWAKRHATLSEALAIVREALEVTRGDPEMQPRLLVDAGLLRSQMGATAEAVAEIDRAVALARATEKPLLEGMALLALGVAEERRSRLDRSIAHIGEALAIFRRGGHLQLEGRALFCLMVFQGRQARFEEARALFREAREVFRRLEDEASEAELLANLGATELGQGELDDAERHLSEAMAAARRVGNRLFEAGCMGNLGIVAIERGDAALGELQTREALDRLHGYEGARFYAEYQVFLALAQSLLGKSGQAAEGLATVRRHFEESDDQDGLAFVSTIEGATGVGSGEVGPERAARTVAASLPGRPANDSLAVALRILDRLGGRKGAVPAPKVSLTLGVDTSWFSVSGGERVDLRNRGPARRIVGALAAARRERPGAGIGPPELFAIGWPGDSIRPDSAATRVYTTIRLLRTLGMGPVLARYADGYLFGPEIDLTIAED